MEEGRRTVGAEILVAVGLWATLVVGDPHGQVVPIDKGDYSSEGGAYEHQDETRLGRHALS